MKKFYLQSIAVFGVALPLLACLIVIIITKMVTSSMLSDFNREKQTYSRELAIKAEANKLKKENEEKEERLATWEQLLTGESFSKLKNNLRTAIDNNSASKTLLITESSRASNMGADFAKINGSPAHFQYGLRGTYKEVQHSLTELEIKTPNLILNNMRIKPQDNQKFLELNLTYTLWEESQK